MEIDYKKLKESGITDNGKKKQFCPECHESRTNKRDKSLSVDWDKCIAHCHYCGKSFFFGKTGKIGYAPKVVQPSAKQEVQGYKKPGRLANEEPLDENMKQWFVTRVHVQKVKLRHLGYPGVASFQYNTHNGRFVPMEESKTPDLPNQDPVWDNSNWLGEKVPEQKRLGI